MPDLSWVTHNARMILISRGLRAFAYGFLAVLLAVYLEALGLDVIIIGVVITISLVGSTVFTLLASPLSQRWGRRRLLIANSLIMIGAGIVLATATDLWQIIVAALTGTLGVTNVERGIFATVEQAMLPQTADERHRTDMFAIYNMVAAVTSAAGALASGLPLVLESALGFGHLDALRTMMLLWTVVGGTAMLLVFRLSPEVELTGPSPHGRWGVHKSARNVAKLAGLSAMDSLGGGFVVQSILAYWFYAAHGLSLAQLGQVFAVGGLFEAASYWAAARVANRFGLVNTMVFSHIPANLLLILMALAPNGGLAALCYLLRQTLAQMDVPTRQSYIMALVEPDERVAAAGITTVARSAAQSLSPTISGFALLVASGGLPLFLAGGIKIVYDILLYVNFRDLRPPEEVARRETARAAAAKTRP